MVFDEEGSVEIFSESGSEVVVIVDIYGGLVGIDPEISPKFRTEVRLTVDIPATTKEEQ